MKYDIHIGFDDTDSPSEGCTTYIAALLVEKFLSKGFSFIDYPNLIRLNPNVPWKTRGNGAICLRIRSHQNRVEEIIEIVIDEVRKNSDLGYEGTNPGVVFFFGNLPQELRDFAKKTIQGVVKMNEALGLIKKFGAEALGFKNGRGIIGGLAAIGEPLWGDHTYEVIAYRAPENRGKTRNLNLTSIKKMDKKTWPLTFNNIDPETDRILVTPRGPDPILYGVRGESPKIVRKAHEMMKQNEQVERWVIFRTNQGTDTHLRRIIAIKNARPFNPIILKGTVFETPKIIMGGHVIFSIKDETGEIDCAAYKPTGILREKAKNLIPGDLIEAHGGVRPASSSNPLTINLEKIRILKLSPKTVFVNPLCPICGKRMKSMGTEKGFRCEKCGFRSSQLNKVMVTEKRKLEKGLYVTSPRSQRHLTKPLCRYGKEKTGGPERMVQNWYHSQKLK